MVTEKARTLKYGLIAAGTRNNLLWNVFWDEMFDNCNPTKDEFVDMAGNAVLTSNALWELMKKPEKWLYV